MSKASIAALCLLLPSLLLAGDLRAQADTWGPIEVAARHVIDVDSLGALGGRLVLDTLRAGLHAAPHPPPIAEGIARLAVSLGARTGSLEEVMVCLPDIPTPEEYRRGRCRFEGGVGTVLQVSQPEVTESGLSVSVIRWTYTRRPLAETHSDLVNANGIELLLSQNDQGEWRVSGAGLVSHAHM